MERFKFVSGPAAPLLRRDVDTDIIIRIERLTGLPKDQLGQYAFEVWRGPDFILDREPFVGAPILIAGANFGCGSSREAAVWALQGLGLRVVIAPSFGEIFMSNCFQNGVLPVVLPEQQVADLAEQAQGVSPHLQGIRGIYGLRFHGSPATSRPRPTDPARGIDF